MFRQRVALGVSTIEDEPGLTSSRLCDDSRMDGSAWSPWPDNGLCKGPTPFVSESQGDYLISLGVRGREKRRTYSSQVILVENASAGWLRPTGREAGVRIGSCRGSGDPQAGADHQRRDLSSAKFGSAGERSGSSRVSPPGQSGSALAFVCALLAPRTIRWRKWSAPGPSAGVQVHMSELHVQATSISLPDAC
jgi:hypothetical protein